MVVEGHSAPVPVKQWCSKFLLQPQDHPAQGGLGNKQFLGGLGDVLTVRHCHKIVQLIEFHMHPPSGLSISFSGLFYHIPGPRGNGSWYTFYVILPYLFGIGQWFAPMIK